MPEPVAFDKDALPPGATVVARQGVLGTGLDREYVLLDPDPGVYYGLNEVGTEIWQFIQQPRRFEEIQRHVCAAFDVDPERCAEDIRALVADLLDRRLVTVGPPAAPTGA